MTAPRRATSDSAILGRLSEKCVVRRHFRRRWHIRLPHSQCGANCEDRKCANEALHLARAGSAALSGRRDWIAIDSIEGLNII